MNTFLAFIKEIALGLEEWTLMIIHGYFCNIKEEKKIVKEYQARFKKVETSSFLGYDL
jgi:hypothetical protein